MNSIANLPYFLTYFGASLVLLALFLAIYTRLTPAHEWTLIREGNVAAALSLAGATLGFCLPLASAIIHSDGLLDMAVWALVSLVLQLLCFAAMRLLRPDVSGGIARGDMAEATVLAAGSVALGILNAACLS
jgi:putative membrane protein